MQTIASPLGQLTKPFGILLAVIYWIVCLQILLLAYVPLCRDSLSHQYLVSENGQKTKIQDFAWLYTGGIIAKHSGPDDELYDSERQNKFLKQVIAPSHLQYPMFLEYPPPFFLILQPFANLDLVTAYRLWDACSALLTVAAIVVLCRLSNFSWLTTAGAIVAAFSFSPTFQLFRVGQSTAISLLLISLFWYLMEHKRYFFAGVMAGLASVKPQFALLLIIFAVLSGRKSILGGLFVSLAALLAVSSQCFGLHNLMSWPSAVVGAEANEGYYCSIANGLAHMNNIRGLLDSMLGADTGPIRMTASLLFAAGALALAIPWWKNRKHLTAYQLKVFAILSTLIMIVLGLHSWDYDYVLLIVPCVLLWCLTGKRMSGQVLGKYCIRVFILALPLISGLCQFGHLDVKIAFWCAVVLLFFTALLAYDAKTSALALTRSVKIDKKID